MACLNKEQAKISMVIPCYNKVQYIVEMLDSIIAQKWSNIELILVNDGSTDGTREIIEAYLPKLRERGFDVIVLDQINSGVCAAAKNGLSKITGDYVCLVDCDDELDPSYVSTVVQFMEENPEYDYTACHLIKYTESGEGKVFIERGLRPITDGCLKVCEMYLMEQVVMTVWVYVVRISYFYKCGIVDSYFTDTKGSHEPGYIIPLTANSGRVKYFPLPLYRFNANGEGHSRFFKFEQAKKFYDEYRRLSLIAIERIADKITGQRKEKLIILCNMFRFSNLLFYADKLAEGEESVYQEIFDELNAYLFVTKLIKYEISYERLRVDWFKLIGVVQKKIMGEGDANGLPATPIRRIIGYGALGKRAERFLPILKGTLYEPTELWDVQGDDIMVRKPVFYSLSNEDLLIVFPKGIVMSECAAKVMEWDEIWRTLQNFPELYFPQLCY